MGRRLHEPSLASVAARSKLKASAKPYWRALDAGLHLGYRKGKSGGRWCLRRYVGDGKYDVITFATADDFQDADSRDVLTYSQAVTRAREEATKAAEAANPAAEPLTVRRALELYHEWLGEHGKSVATSRNRAANDILPTLGEVLVGDLTVAQLRAWLSQLAAMPRRVRGKKGAAARTLARPASEEEIRRRRSSANRSLTILKAALNHAFREGNATTDAAWRAVAPFREADAARVRYLSHDEIRRLVNAAEPAFRRLLQAALATGARFGELACLKVEDYNADAGTLHIRRSKSGRGRHVVMTDEGVALFRSLTAGRDSAETLLLNASGDPWGASHQARPMAQACAAARIIPHANFHALRHTYASHAVMNGMPLIVVAKNLGHADARMCERNYAHLASDFVTEQVKRYAPVFGLSHDENVVPLAGRR